MSRQKEREALEVPLVTSPEQAARLSQLSMFGGPFVSVAAPLTRAERVKALQAEANAGTVEMVQDLDKGLLALLDQINELEGLKTPIVGIEAMVRELKPQIERWSIIVGGIAGKHKGR